MSEALNDPEVGSFKNIVLDVATKSDLSKYIFQKEKIQDDLIENVIDTKNCLNEVMAQSETNFYSIPMTATSNEVLKKVINSGFANCDVYEAANKMMTE